MLLRDLAATFFAWLDRECSAARCRPATASYYRRMLRPLLAAAGDKETRDLIPWDLERVKTGWHSVQAGQRLLNWAQSMGLASDNPFKRVAKPATSLRETTVGQHEQRRIMRRSSRPLRDVLLALVLTAARPTEIRGLTWSCYHDSPTPHFVLNDFRAKARRRDGVRVRVLPVVPRLARLLGRLRRRSPATASHVFLNCRGRPWTGNALSLAFRRLRRRLHLKDDLVPYSLRHTAATRACVAGVRDKLLAELLGHTSTRTTARYQHPDLAELAAIAERIVTRKRKTG